MSLDNFAAGRLQDFVFMGGRGFTYFAATPGLPLSLKTVSNGRACYRFDRREVMIDDGGYLILNNRQPYSIEIASPTLAETFILWFPDGWIEDVSRSLTKSGDQLLADPETSGSVRSFFEKYTPHDSTVSPKVAELRNAYKSGEKIEEAWLEERVRILLSSMLKSQRDVERIVSQLPAMRTSTRQELWKRVNRARDFLHSRSHTAVSLSEAAAVACLSPFHFLRSFQAAFEVTPHQYLTFCRVERAKFLLQRTELPLTDIAFDAGFVTPSSFSSAFRKITGMSPRSWREERGVLSRKNSKIRKVFLTSRV
jgi:AraC family transcriptional regulator